MKAEKILQRAREVWRVRVRLSGKLVKQLVRPTKAEAVQAATDWLNERQQYGEQGSADMAERLLLAEYRGKLTLAQMEQALRAAAEQAQASPLTVDQAAAEWLDESRSKAPDDGGWKEVTFRSNSQRIGLLRSELGAVALAALTPDQLNQHIRRRGASARNQWGAVAAFLHWCRAPKCYMTHNPLEHLRAPNRKAKRKDIFDPATLKRLLEYAAPPFRRMVALQALAGLRTSEALRVTAKDLKASTLYIGELKTAGRGMRERYVELCPAALAWLTASPLPASGPLVGANERNSRRWIKQAKADLGIAWPHNVLRRSFGSHDLAVRPASETAKHMGHTSAETTYAKYYRAVPVSVGNEWFAILP